MKKDNGGNDGYFSWFYPDMDGNGKIDHMDEAIYNDMMKKKKEARNFDYDEDDDEEGYYDFDDNSDDDASDDDFSGDDDLYDEDLDDAFFSDEGGEGCSSADLNASDEAQYGEEDNDEEVQKNRLIFVKNVQEHGQMLRAPDVVKPFDTGLKYQSEQGVLRYLKKFAYIQSDIIDFERALFEKFPYLTKSFDYEDGDAACGIIYEYLCHDTKKGLEMWRYLLEIFPHKFFVGTQGLERQLAEWVFEKIDLDEAKNVRALVEFFADEYVYEYLFKLHVWDKQNDDMMMLIFDATIRTKNFDLAASIFYDVTKNNGGFTKKTLDQILGFLVLRLSELRTPPQNLKDLAKEQAKNLGIRGSKIIKDLAKLE